MVLFNYSLLIPIVAIVATWWARRSLRTNCRNELLYLSLLEAGASWLMVTTYVATTMVIT